MELNNWSLAKSAVLGGHRVIISGPLMEEVYSLREDFEILWPDSCFSLS